MPDIPAPVATQVQQPDFLKNYGMITEIQRNQAATQNIKSETYQRDYNTLSLQLARAAHDVMAQPPGPERTARWNHHVNQFADRGLISPQDRDYYTKSGPNEMVLNSAIRRGMDVESNMRASGMTEGLGARERAAWQYHDDMNPDKRSGYPAQTQGNLGPQSQPGMIPTNQQPQGPLGATTGPMQINGPNAGANLPGPVQPTPAPTPTPAPVPSPAAAGPVPVGGMIPNRPGETNTTLMPTGGPTPAPAAAATPQNPAVPGPSKPYYDEVQPIKTWTDATTGRGIVNPGRHPEAVKAQDLANVKMKDEINPAVDNATKVQSQLEPLRAEVARGKVVSDRLADIKSAVAEVIYGLTKDYDLATKFTKVKVPEQELARKTMTEMGLTFARQTEGAREAVMAIRIALGAKPNLLNTEDGNLKVIDLLNRGAQYDVERGHAAVGYFQKQQDKVGSGHLAGFDQYIAAKHPPSEWISKSVPYVLPTSKTDMKPNVTYEWDVQDPQNKGQPLLDPQTHRPVTKKAVWDGKNLIPAE